MKIWFPDYYTEAHRTPDRKKDLLDELKSIGVDCVLTPDHDCNLCFCGSIFKAEDVRRYAGKLPVVHYNWDLYPAVINSSRPKWYTYLENLKSCKMILVPGVGTALRTTEYIGRASEIVYAPVKIWDVPQLSLLGDTPETVHSPKTYYLDVMRDYPWDPNHRLAESICRRLKINLVRTKTTRPWDEFRYLVANAKALLSCCVEASTGGLTLLEGYAHGVPVIAYDGPLNATKEYFGDRATYFSDIDSKSLIRALSRTSPLVDPVECRKWVEDHYSDRVFAQRLKECFTQCLH